MLNSLRIAGPTEIAPGLTLVPTGGLIAYVHASGAAGLDRLPVGMADPDLGFFTTINAALNATRANRGDYVCVLPGHTETLSVADGWSNAKAGVTVLGFGNSFTRPIITLSATGSQLTLNDANFHVENLVFVHASANVTLAADVSAAGVELRKCFFVASDYGAVANKMTTVLRLSSGADDFVCQDTRIIGGATTAITDTCLINAAVARPRFSRCQFAAKLGTSEGLITMATAAPTDVLIEYCTLENRVASSTVALKGIASATGLVQFCLLGLTVADGGGVGAGGFNTKGNLTFYQVHTATVGLGGVSAGTATTV